MKQSNIIIFLCQVHQPSVVFIDEIDSLLTSRSEGEHESSRKIKITRWWGPLIDPHTDHQF